MAAKKSSERQAAFRLARLLAGETRLELYAPKRHHAAIKQYAADLKIKDKDKS